MVTSANSIEMNSSVVDDNKKGDEYGIYCGGKLTCSGTGSLAFNVAAAASTGKVSPDDAKEGGWSAPFDAKALIYAHDSVTINSGSYSNTGLPWSAIRSRDITINNGTFNFQSYGHCIYSENFTSLQDEKIKLTINGGTFTLKDDRNNPTYDKGQEQARYSIFGQKDVDINGGTFNINSHNGICGDRVDISGNGTVVNITNNEEIDHNISQYDTGIVAEWSWLRMSDNCKVNVDVVDKTKKAGKSIVLLDGTASYTGDDETTDFLFDNKTSSLSLNGISVYEVESTGNAHYFAKTLQDVINEATAGAKLIELNTDMKTDTLTINEGKDITIDLNGHTIDRGLKEATANGSVIVVNGGNLTIKDGTNTNTGKITGGNITGDYPDGYGGGVLVKNGKLVLETGQIAGNSARYGGGISVLSGEATINGGIIQDNKSTAQGGGIYLLHKGSLKLNTNGKITNNYAGGGGGGVFARGNFMMSGGEVSKNTAIQNGGGVYVYGDDNVSAEPKKYSFKMTGGNITSNYSMRKGGGVIADKYNMEMIMTGGEVSGNDAELSGGGIYAVESITVGGTAKVVNNLIAANSSDGNFTGGTTSNTFLKSGKKLLISHSDVPSDGMKMGISMAENGAFVDNVSSDAVKYFFTDDKNYTIEYNESTGEVKLAESINSVDKLQSRINDATSGEVITLDTDINTNGKEITIPSGKTITFDLNGHTIDRGLKEATANGSVIVVKGGNLTINDFSKEKQGKITGGNSTGQFGMNGGGITVLDGGKLILNSGNITGNYGYLGGGICVSSGEAILNGGSVSNNKSSNGGGIYTVMGTKLILSSDACVSNNKAEKGGGGIFAKGDFLMSGGEISKNTAIENGGGVYVYGDHTVSAEPKKYSFKMTGGKITSNYSMRKGGGVIADKYNMEMIMTGGEIAGNDAELSGGGIYAVESITVGGTAKVVNNLVAANSSDGKFTGGTTNNTFLKSGKKLLISSSIAPSSGMKVGVSMALADAFAEVSSSALANYFFSDNSSYKVQYNETTGKLELVKNDQQYSPTEQEEETPTPITDNKVSIDKISNPTVSKDGITPEIKIECDGKLLVENVDYTVEYIGELDEVGTVTVVIKGIGKYSGETRTTFKVLPENTKVSSLKKGKKSFSIKVDKLSKSKVNGYKVRYSTKKTMADSKTKTIGKKYNKTSLTVKKLKSKKTYYVQVRTYKKAKDGKNYYSNWSTVKKVKTK